MAKRKGRTRPRKRPRAKPRRARLQQRAVEAALAGVVHDIRTPLTGIVALSELLATSDLGARERGWADAIKNGADHLAALTTLIVDAAKAEAAGLTLAARAVLAAPSRRSGRHRARRARRQQGHQDRDRHRRRSARDWSPATRCDCARRWKTSPTMRSSSRSKAPSSSPPAPSPPARKRVQLVFTVADTGIGSIRTTSKICFARSRRRARRWRAVTAAPASGLVFVKRVAEAMGGDLRVTSKPGRGSQLPPHRAGRSRGGRRADRTR